MDLQKMHEKMRAKFELLNKSKLELATSAKIMLDEDPIKFANHFMQKQKKAFKSGIFVGLLLGFLLTFIVYKLAGN